MTEHSDYQTVHITRDCDAILIPYGQPMRLAKGTLVVVVQALGDSFTLQMNGNLLEVDGKDADALEREIPPSPLQALSDDASLEDQVWAVLRGCYDPEIPVNIVDLGLVYACDIIPLEAEQENQQHQETQEVQQNQKTQENQKNEKKQGKQAKAADDHPQPAGYKVYVQMTLTSPTCGMGPVLVQKIERHLKLLEGVREVVVDLVFSPPWSRDRLSLEAQLKLGLF